MRAKGGIGLAAALVALAALGLFAACASATQYQRPLVGAFGTSEQPSFEEPAALAVDPSSGDLLVVAHFVGPGEVKPTGDIQRFKPNGEPAPFAALGTNVIDGSAGPDKTPQGQLEFVSGLPLQVAVDPTNGNIYVTQRNANLVDIFSSEGTYLGSLTQAGAKFFNPCGVVVDSAGTVYIAQNDKISKFVPTANPPVNSDNTANFRVEYEGPCHMALGTGPSAGSIFLTNNGGAHPGPRTLKVNEETGAVSEFTIGVQEFGVPPTGYEELVTVDPTNGNPLILAAAVLTRSEAAEFDGSGATAGPVLSRLVDEGASEAARVADFVANSSGDIYVVLSGSGAPHPQHVSVYGHPVIAPTVAVGSASDIASSEATVSGSVNPEGVAHTECFFEYGPTNGGGFTTWEHSVPCEESIPTDSSEHTVHAKISGLSPNGAKYGFRLAATNANGVTERSSAGSLLTGSSAETKPATVTGLGTATLNAVVHPEGSQYTECVFEWGLTSNAGYEHTAPCTPKAGELPPDSGGHTVSASLAKLREATVYRFRVKATNGAGTQTGAELIFETFGSPRIVATRAADASQETATLEAEVDPHGYATSYRFEWGPTASYGHATPAGFEPIGSGTPPVQVSAGLSGLSTGTVYHYRVVASSLAGTTAGPDQELETLNSCGLPDGRCLELVSPREPGPVALPGEGNAISLPFQASEAPGSLAYEVELGFPGATSGGEILYRGSRGTDGWESPQYSPGLTGASGGSGVRAAVLGLSPNLDCGVLESKLALTSDPVARVNIEAGGGNLYRRGPDDSYTLITDVPPEAPGGAEAGDEFELVGMSADCGRVIFTTALHYSGVAGTGEHRLYEWDHGALRYVSWVPNGSGEVVTAAGPGSGSSIGSGYGSSIEGGYNAVSQDGSRVFFTATSQVGNDSGHEAVFARIDGTKTLDVSQSPLAADTGATYQGATPDGSRVFFLANAGLTADSSSEGRDLYECHIVLVAGGDPECALTDLSVDRDPGGAEAGGVSKGGALGALVGVADDGSHVYFVARGQLVPGRGSTLAQNRAAETLSLYLYTAPSGSVEYVGAISAPVGEGSDLWQVATGALTSYTSRVSHDGRYLLFESRADLTHYDSGGKPIAYLYSAPTPGGGEGRLECVSCRRDRKPSVNPREGSGTVQPLRPQGPFAYRPQSLVFRDGKPLVFFRSKDGLAPGGVEGEWGLYEWAHGQVFAIATDLPGATPPQGVGTLAFLGASSEGADLYFVDSAALNWENPDARRSAWDARVGGGFPEPSPSAACDPGAEGSCQSSLPQPVFAAPASVTFSGPGNLVSPLPAPGLTAKSFVKPLTRPQQLAKALKTCRTKRVKTKRAACEARARKKYGSEHKAKAKRKKSSHAKGRNK